MEPRWNLFLQLFPLHVKKVKGARHVDKLRLLGDQRVDERIDELGRDHRIAVRK